MIKHGNILVTTDFSSCSDEALRRAKVLAKELGAELHLLHVLEPVLVYEEDAIALTPVQEITDIKRKSAQQKLDQYRKQSDIPLHTHLEESFQAPAQAICEFAKKLPADLLVVGRHGHSGGLLEHILIGSVAERVVRFAPCSVLVTKPHGILA